MNEVQRLLGGVMWATEVSSSRTCLSLLWYAGRCWRIEGTGRQLTLISSKLRRTRNTVNQESLPYTKPRH